ncbi:MAG: hypothetical protein ACPLIG_00275 [Candidatus Bathyarchaeales archaeon]
MKRTIFGLTCMMSLLSSVLAGALFFEVAEANPAAMAKLFDNCVITAQSPQNKTYNERTLPLNFTVETNNEYRLMVRYILNNEKPVNVKTQIVSEKWLTGWYGYELGNGTFYNDTYSYPRYTAQGSALLSNLTDGTYCLTVQRYYTNIANPADITIANATTVFFTIDTTPPSISNLSMENKTYYTSNVQLNVVVDEPVSQVIYSLDGQKNITANGNITLTDLPIGEHNLMIYAIDLAGNPSLPKAMRFMIFPTTLLITISVIVVGICIGLLVYLKRRGKSQTT